ncbi:MAG: hypothetical protein H7325_07635 [Pedobacter sp.]|nr:hypothetical protein [Pedobacter sp.]
MNKEIENNEWVGLAPSLAKMITRTPFTTPESYFEALEEQTKTAIFFAEIIDNEQKNGLQVPPLYFTVLSENIATTLKLSENITSEQAFSVPVNYFNQLQDKLAAKITSSKVAKTSKIIRLLNTNLVKYATAACLLLVSSFGIYFYNQHTTSETEILSQTEVLKNQFLYDIDESTIIQNIGTENPIESKNVSVTDTEMENYLLNHYTAIELAQDL